MTAWGCHLCRRRFLAPPGRDLAPYQVGHLHAEHRCRAVRFNGPQAGQRCVLVAPHRYRHHRYEG